MTPATRVRLVVLIAFLAVAVAAVALTARKFGGTPRGPKVAPTELPELAFDAARWQAGDAAERIGMARRLIASEALLGKSSLQLEEMLGPAAIDTIDASRATSGPPRRRWHLGQRESGASLMFPYDEWLVVELNHAGVATRAVIVSLD